MKLVFLGLAMSLYSFCLGADEILYFSTDYFEHGSITHNYTRSMLDKSIDWNPLAPLPFKISDAINQTKEDLKELKINGTGIYRLNEIGFERYKKTNKWTYEISLTRKSSSHSISLPYCLTNTPQKHFGKIISLDINAFNNINGTEEKESLRKPKNYIYLQKGDVRTGKDKLQYEYELHIHETEIYNTSSWDPNQEDIPLSIEQAYKASLKDISNKIPDTRNFILTGIAIKRFNNTENWYYLLRYDNYETNEYTCSLILFSAEPLQPDKIKKEDATVDRRKTETDSEYKDTGE